MISRTSALRFQDYLRFVITVTVAHVITYVIAGTLAYSLIYKSAIEAGNFDASMRSPENAEEWKHVTTWMLPAQVLRGSLMGLALCPFLATLSAWSFKTRFWTILGLLLVFSVWSVTMPSPGSIEGWVYLRPGNGPKLPNPLLGYVEVPTQLAIFSLLLAWRIGRIARLTEDS